MELLEDELDELLDDDDSAVFAGVDDVDPSLDAVAPDFSPPDFSPPDFSPPDVSEDDEEEPEPVSEPDAEERLSLR